MTKKTSHRVIVDTVVVQVSDEQRYFDNATIRDRCIRPFELQAGFKFNDFTRSAMEQCINTVLHSVWNSRGIIPSDKSGMSPIPGVPQFLAVKKDIGWLRTRWDWTHADDWEKQLEALLENKKRVDKALDEFEVIYDYVTPMLRETQKPLGELIQVEFEFDYRRRRA